jgi:hypothetical protein
MRPVVLIECFNEFDPVTRDRASLNPARLPSFGQEILMRT